MKLGIVTATLDWDRASGCVISWLGMATGPLHLYIVGQGKRNEGWTAVTPKDLPGQVTMQGFMSKEILGVVPAFAIGVQKALRDGCSIIACLHDDLEISTRGWDQQVINTFKTCPRAGLVGFGGGKGLGAADIYQTPYNPMQLAREQFISNMRDAEAHGQRSETAQPVACLDGFSQIGLRSFWRNDPLRLPGAGVEKSAPSANLFTVMEQLGIIHHAYDAALGAYAKQLGYQVWFIPVACHHYGGRTAVGDTRYHDWASSYEYEDLESHRGGRGDQGFWEKSHRVVYELFRSVLPIRT